MSRIATLFSTNFSLSSEQRFASKTLTEKYIFPQKCPYTVTWPIRRPPPCHERRTAVARRHLRRQYRRSRRFSSFLYRSRLRSLPDCLSIKMFLSGTAISCSAINCRSSFCSLVMTEFVTTSNFGSRYRKSFLPRKNGVDRICPHHFSKIR